MIPRVEPRIPRYSESNRVLLLSKLILCLFSPGKQRRILEIFYVNLRKLPQEPLIGVLGYRRAQLVQGYCETPEQGSLSVA